MSEETVNPIESQAREMGWLPKEEYGDRDPSKWVPADIFVARAPLFEKIEEETRRNKNLRKELDSVKNVVHELSSHVEKARKEGYHRALDELRKEKRIALAEEDLIKADELQEKIDDIKEAQKVHPAPQPTATIPEEFVEWSTKNEWYKLDTEMRDFADAIGIVEHKKGKSPQEVLKAVTDQVKKRFPEKFRNPMKDKDPVVDSPGVTATLKKSKFTPTSEQRAIAKRFADQGVMTEEQYYKDLAAMADSE